ncbi:LuxR C-terminal-related transcriptional regulator [Streptomyces gibsoniae]
MTGRHATAGPEREAEVLALVARGLSNNAISQELNVSEAT